MLGAPLIGISYLAWRFVGLPFVAFDVFDWLTRTLPGPIVTFGIESVVRVVRGTRLGPTAETAKSAEQAMAVAVVLVACGSAGAGLFAFLGRPGTRRPYLAGMLAGAVLGAPAALISAKASRVPTGGPIVGGLWVLAAFLVWGVLVAWSRHRIGQAQDSEVARLDRRRFLLTLGGVSAVITVAGAYLGSLRAERRTSEGAAGGRWSASHPLPNAGAEVSPAPGTRPEFTPLEQHYRIDINTRPVEVDERTWRLRVHGLVDAPLALTLDDLRSRHPPLDQFVTIACISNPVAGDLIGTTRWTGVSLKRLLQDWRLKPSATHLKIRSADGFFEVVPLATVMADERVMLAYAWDGVPLTAGHGFPLRIYIPNLYGM
jgi:DMSO/TMAO reductase YedYZ molybdopterin-dependent catalytic subunit